MFGPARAVPGARATISRVDEGALTMRTSILLQLVLAGAAVAQTSTKSDVARYPFANHHHVPGDVALQQEIARLRAWLAEPGHRDAVVKSPGAIADFHALTPEQGGPSSRQIRWFPHVLRPDRDDATHWETPIARINSVAVPVFTPVELYSAPAGPAATLLEFVPLAVAATGAAEQDRVTVRQGYVTDYPMSHLDREPDAGRRARAQVREERRLLELRRAGEVGVPRFVTFDELSDWRYEQGLRGAPAAVLDLDGTSVVLVGRMLPVDELEAMPQFLLVRDGFEDDWGVWPEVHQVVRVDVPGAARVDYTTEPVRVVGVLRVGELREDDVIVGIHRVDAVRVEPVMQ
jgi:hypothetical protein